MRVILVTVAKGTAGHDDGQEDTEITGAHLEIYVDEGCLSCRRSLELAAHVRSRFPEVDVRVFNSGEPGGLYGHLVLATPTFILNGKKMSLGNPSPAQLDEAILNAMKGPRK